MKYSFAAGISMSAFFLFACNHSENTPSPSAMQEGTGAARIQLPAAPREFLARAEAGSELVFALQVTGGHMQPIQTSWPLSTEGEKTVTLSGIPAGIRSFAGRILEIDGVTGDTLVTHRGADSAHIIAGRTTHIRLYMGRVSDGGASICLAVEGWISNPDCLPSTSEVAGCWSITVSGADTLRPSFQTRLRIEIVDSNVTAILAWSQDAEDTAYGTFAYGTLYIGGDNSQPFRMKGSVTGGILRADLSSPKLAKSAMVRGVRGDCNTIPVPIVPDYSGCWKVILRDFSSDTLDLGDMIWTQQGYGLSATLSLLSGSTSDAVGYVREDGTALLGEKSGTFTFKGGLDKKGLLNGALSIPASKLNGMLEGNRVSCPSESSIQ